MEDPLPVLFASLLGLLALGSLNGQVEARALFAFGDSLVDNGNNNYLATVARADSPPYGIDYPGRRPTGRFSNGLNIPDIISESLGEEPTLPYLSPQLNGQRLLVGANFGSAGVGILNDTGILFGNIIRMPKQLLYFEQYQERLAALIGADAAQQRVNQALGLITLGANDFIGNYYLVPFSARSRQYSLPDFVRFLISEYRKILMRLYELGVRRALVAGTGPIGCLPSELETGSRNGECNPDLVRAAELFNPQLERMLSGLNSNLGADIFIAACTRESCFDFVYNPGAYGFVTSKIACCGQGPYNGLGICTVLSNLCPDRTLYAFWDRWHPTEKASRIIVNNILRGSTDYMKPMNLSTILAMDPWT